MRRSPQASRRLRRSPPAKCGAPDNVCCYVPDWLKDGRCWGIGCQLYGLGTSRNWGIGDFEDLARFAEIAAAAGADFVGVNPLHALFMAAPERCSPFSPSSRRIPEPALYRHRQGSRFFRRWRTRWSRPRRCGEAELVDYRKVGPLKAKALGVLFRIFQARGGGRTGPASSASCSSAARRSIFTRCSRRCRKRWRSRATAPAGMAGPTNSATRRRDSVRAFAEEQRELVTFHCWLQWLADRQLGEAQARAHRGRHAHRALSRSRRRRRAGRLGHLGGPRARGARAHGSARRPTISTRRDRIGGWRRFRRRR